MADRTDTLSLVFCSDFHLSHSRNMDNKPITTNNDAKTEFVKFFQELDIQKFIRTHTNKRLIDALRIRLKLPLHMVLDTTCIPTVEKYVDQELDSAISLSFEAMCEEEDTDADISERTAIVNLLTRPFKIFFELWPGVEQEDFSPSTVTVHPLLKDETCEWTADIPKEGYIRFDFGAKGWPITQERNAGDLKQTGSEPMLIPRKDSHASLTLKGPAPLVSLLNLQTQVDPKHDFFIISVNAHFLLFNESSYCLKATAFAVRLSDDENSVAVPPSASPAVQAATVFPEWDEEVPTDESPKEEEAAAASPSVLKEEIKKKKPCPLELWHLLGTGDADIVPFLMLSSVDTKEEDPVEYGYPICLDLSHNNRRFTVPVKSKEVINVTLVVQLKDRENGQQMLITVKDATPDLLVHNECEIPLLLTEVLATEWKMHVADPFEWTTKIPGTSQAHFVLRSDANGDVGQTDRYVALRINKDAEWSCGIRLHDSLKESVISVPDYGEVKVCFWSENGTKHMAVKPVKPKDDLADDLKSQLSISGTSQ